jgi:hypothetical protein
MLVDRFRDRIESRRGRSGQMVVVIERKASQYRRGSSARWFGGSRMT